MDYHFSILKRGLTVVAYPLSKATARSLKVGIGNADADPALFLFIIIDNLILFATWDRSRTLLEVVPDTDTRAIGYVL